MTLRLVWVCNYPAHYMSLYHAHLENIFKDIHFIYYAPKNRGLDFAHEKAVKLNRSTLLPFHWPFVRLWYCLEDLKPKSVLISGNYPRSNLVAVLWAKLHCCEIYYLSDVNVLDDKNRSAGLVKQFLLRILLSTMTKLLVIGTRNEQFYSKICATSSLGSRALFFPLPHLCDYFECEVKTQHRLFTFLVLGRLVNIKGVDQALRAFAKLDMVDRAKCQLIIAGDGDCKTQLENLSKDLDISQSIEFLGSIPSDMTPQIFVNADVVIVPSHNEPWGLVVNEALSSACPVIAPYWLGCAIDLIHNMETGLVLSDNSPDKIKDAMKYFLDNPNEAVRMGLSGRRLIREGGWNIHQSIKAFTQLLAGLKY